MREYSVYVLYSYRARLGCRWESVCVLFFMTKTLGPRDGQRKN